MVNSKKTELDMYELKNKIMTEVEKRRNNNDVICSDVNNKPNVWNEISYNLDLARKHSEVGIALPPMHTFKGMKRKIAVKVGNIMLRIGQIFTRDQRIVNQLFIDTVQILSEEIKTIEKCSDNILQDKFKNFENYFQSFLNEEFEKNETNIRGLTEDVQDLKRLTDDVQELKGLTDDFKMQNDQFKQNIQEINTSIREACQTQNQIRSQIITQERRLSILLEEARKRLPEPYDNNQLLKMAGELKDINDNFYLNFEDQFRGSRADIKERLRIYLPVLREAQAGSIGRDILDIGCGRGEWLELLKEENFKAKGVDQNKAAIKLCCDHGLDAIYSDAFTYLQAIPNESLGAVTAFHVIEHLSIDLFFRLIDEMIRILKPGGVAIIETPNPQNIIVGACNFYIDPTHQKPVHPATLQFIVEARGLCRVEVKKLHPCTEELHLFECNSDINKKFNEYFYGPQDYAVIGWKT
jgi:2-polyprenyl-3-methyl-5-hydroxy-6-metoxy-1,4-benzoquinol methylase